MATRTRDNKHLKNGLRASNSKRALKYETLEVRDLLTTMLVNFYRDAADLDPAVASDFAVADANVDLTAIVNLVDDGGATGLAGTDGTTFDVEVSGALDYTTNKGVYEDEPILDSYLYVNNNTATVTVSSIEEIAAGQLVSVTLFGVGDANNQESEFTLNYDGVTIGVDETEYGGSFLDTYVTFSFMKQSGIDEFEVVFQNAGNGSNTGAFNGFSITTPTAVRINAGGDAHVDSEGNLFLADQYYVGGRLFDVTDDIFIPGTGSGTVNDEDVDDILYQTERFDTNFGYEIPVANGYYTLRLHYAEIYFDDVGERIFNVTAEGNLISEDLDIFEARQNAFTPGNFSALIQEFDLVEVNDGSLSLNFNSEGAGGVDNGKISAIEVIQVGTPQLAIATTGGVTTVTEGGATDTYSLSLTVAPTADVIVTLSMGSEVTTDVTQLTFTPENFDQQQTVTVTAVDDDDEEGTQTVTIGHSLASEDPLYDGVPALSLPVVVLDDDLVEVQFSYRTLASGISNPTTGTFGPDGRLYVANGAGQIRAYTLDGNNNVTATQIISAVEDLTEFVTILGIAFDPFETVLPGEQPTIYVSRSSINNATTVYGSRVSTLSGADYATVTDIVTGLAVSGFDHGVNGLAFDGNGDLLIAIGGNTNTGVFDGVYGSDAPESPLTSAILRARITDPNFNGDIQYEFIDPNDTGIVVPGEPNNQLNGEYVKVVDDPAEVEVEVYGAGLRNPFGLVYTTAGSVFATDNGPNGIAKDELNYVPENAFLGHPSIPRGKLDPRQTLENAEYDVNAPSTADYTAPLAELLSSTNGIDEYRAEAFGGQLRGQLFAQKWNGLVYFFDLNEEGTGLDNINTRTDVGDGLDILAGPGGTIIGIDRNQNRITIAEPIDPTVTEPKAYDIFTWRAPAVGGNQFTIGGANFSSLADTTVYIGGRQATLTSVEDGKIVGILPAVPGDTLQDVVVTSAGTTSRLTDAFLPLNGSPKLLGDYDFDGDVDDADYDVWSSNYGSISNPAADGNDDGVVDAADYSVWRDNYGATQAAVVSLAEDTETARSVFDDNKAVVASEGRRLAAAVRASFRVESAPDAALDRQDRTAPVPSDSSDLLLIAAARVSAETDDNLVSDFRISSDKESSKDEALAGSDFSDLLVLKYLSLGL